MKRWIKITALALLALLVIALSALLLRPSQLVARAEAKKLFTLPTSHFIEWRGAELHYTDEGQGAAVIMVHGYGGSYRNFQKLNDSLRSQYRVIRLDLPGFGLSDLPGAKDGKIDFLKLYSDYFTFILDTLRVDSVYMIGNSMGGMMCWNAALQHPDKVKKLVLIGSAGYELEKIAQGVSRLMNIPGMGLLYAKGMPLSMSESGARRIYADTSRINHVEVANNNKLWNREGNMEAAYRLMQSRQFPDSGRIKEITVPTLILWGRDDRIVPVDHAYKFQRDIKGARLVVIDTCGHVPMIERPAETASAIRKFLAE